MKVVSSKDEVEDSGRRITKLEAKVKELQEEVWQADDEKNHAILKEAMWQKEICMILTDRTLRDCDDESLGYRKLIGSELEEVLKNKELRRQTSSNSFRPCKTVYFKMINTEGSIVGRISENEYNCGGYNVEVFAIPEGKKRFKRLLIFTELKTSFSARLALSFLFTMLEHNEFNIENVVDNDFRKAIIESAGCDSIVVGLYHSLDDKFRYAVTYDESFGYHSYYFQKTRGGHDMIGEDMDCPTMIRALCGLTRGMKESLDDDFFESDEYDEDMDYFGLYGDEPYEI